MTKTKVRRLLLNRDNGPWLDKLRVLQGRAENVKSCVAAGPSMCGCLKKLREIAEIVLADIDDSQEGKATQ